MNPFAQQPLMADGADDQFRLVRIQTFNWGTFANLFDFPIAKAGYLFVGPSGSGKSTVLDAHTALLTPPKWLDFNVAAREAEGKGRDRNVLTYVRGAWAQQTGEGGETVSQYLRTGTTWTAIAETYRNTQGRVVVLAQVLWVRGNSNAPGDVKRLYLTLQRPFDLGELEFFPRHEFDVRRFKHELPDAAVHHEFSAYQERFLRLLGIDNERALRLLHKTQSAKNLGDLNTFLRGFMLDEPETFDCARRLVEEFDELNAAHQAVVSAREQVETLDPARLAHEDHERAAHGRGELAEVLAGLDGYASLRRRALLLERQQELATDLEAAAQKARQLGDREQAAQLKLQQLQARRHDLGGTELEQLQRQIEEAERQKPERLHKREIARAACETMGWAMPDEVVWFVQRTEAARQHVAAVGECRTRHERRMDELKQRRKELDDEFTATVRQVQAMEKKRSNIPFELQEVRERMLAALDLPDDALPFAGELIEVRTEDAAWQGAIERVLGGFARSILVDEAHYAAVSAYMNQTHIGQRLFYHRMLPQSAGNRTPGPDSVVRKLNLQQGPCKAWLSEELKAHFDFECAGTLQAFRAAPRAVTREGQIKHNSTRHEKNDRVAVDDRRHWVLGFDNTAKLALFKAKAQELAAELVRVDQALNDAREADDLQHRRDMACNTLQNMSWAEVDVASLLTRIAELQRQLEEAKASNPDLASLDDDIRRQDRAYQKARDARVDEQGRGREIERRIAECNGKLAELERASQADLTPFQAESLAARFDRTGRDVSLDTLESVTNAVERAVRNEDKQLELEMVQLRSRIESRFTEFNRRWPAESGGLDPTLASAEDYFGRLQRLRKDNLPEFEKRFFKLLTDQSDQNLTMLQSRLKDERVAIRSRMETVNESLRGAPFNEGTYLVIDTVDRFIEDVRQFQASLKEVLSHSFSTEPELAEQRFRALAKLVQRLGSQETTDRNWRALVLDVRQHVEFVARELDQDQREVEVYRSGAGKSGGQRQKLAATILAAALRYQLGGADRALPVFSTVALDEAFDKADAEFTATAMNIFVRFGFQMVVATPLKSVMTLERFIGGACFVHIKDRRKSLVIPIDYDGDGQRLKLTTEVRRADAEAAAA